METPAAHLPIDLWLLVFDEIEDLNFLWSTCRNVSRFWRACVDDFFRHGIVQSTFLDLHYSDIHRRRGPVNAYIHLPMVFDRFSDDGVKAVFQQRTYRTITECSTTGTVRGWIPFIERYCEESGQSKPTVLSESKASDGPPLWEQEHAHWRNVLSVDAKTNYLICIRNMTSIGRGDRPPYYLKLVDAVTDTQLVDLVIDCKHREVSFNWRSTYSLFFRERNFAACQRSRSGKTRVYDQELDAVARRYYLERNQYKLHNQARRKRLQAWVAENKDRMSPELRFWTEHRVEVERKRVQQYLRHDNVCGIEDGEEAEETVPAKLADDHPDLLFWPWSDENGSFVPHRKRRKSGPHGCIML